MSEAVVVSSAQDHELIAIDGHTIQYGGAEGGWCSEHQSFECIERLTPEQCQAVAVAKPVLTDKEVDALRSALRRVEELRGAADTIAEFVLSGVGSIEDEGERAHVVEMVINRLHHSMGRIIGPEGSVTMVQMVPCGPTGDEMFCACGCGGDDSRCDYWIACRNLGQEVSDEHRCCKVGNGQTGGG